MLLAHEKLCHPSWSTFLQPTQKWVTLIQIDEKKFHGVQKFDIMSKEWSGNKNTGEEKCWQKKRNLLQLFYWHKRNYLKMFMTMVIKYFTSMNRVGWYYYRCPINLTEWIQEGKRLFVLKCACYSLCMQGNNSHADKQNLVLIQAPTMPLVCGHANWLIVMSIKIRDNPKQSLLSHNL